MLWISDVPGYRGLGIALLVLLLGATVLVARWWLRAHRAAAEHVDP